MFKTSIQQDSSAGAEAVKQGDRVLSSKHEGEVVHPRAVKKFDRFMDRFRKRLEAAGHAGMPRDGSDVARCS